MDTWRKPHCQETLWGRVLGNHYCSFPQRWATQQEAKGKGPETHLRGAWSFFRDFRKQMAMGNDQFYQALSPRGEHSLGSSVVSTAYKIALRWFYVSTWAWQPYAMLSLKSADNAIQTGASHFRFCFEVLINFPEVVLLYNALRSCALLIFLEKGWLTNRELRKHRVSFCHLYRAM